MLVCNALHSYGQTSNERSGESAKTERGTGEGWFAREHQGSTLSALCTLRVRIASLAQQFSKEGKTTVLQSIIQIKATEQHLFIFIFMFSYRTAISNGAVSYNVYGGCNF